MKTGDLVKLTGSMWSSYVREGQVGLLIETGLPGEPWEEPRNDYSRILFFDGEDSICRNEHLALVQVSNESG